MNTTWECGTPRSTCNAFSILYEPRVKANSKKPPKKTGPKRSKQEWTLIAIETEGQRKDRQLAEREAKILRKNPYSNVALSTRGAADRAAAIRKSGVC